MSRQILVIPTGKLMGLIGQHFQGFLPLDGGLLSQIEVDSHWMEKGLAEVDPNFKQLIPYHAIRCANGNIFVYQRSSDNASYAEQRLQGKYSIGVGGHIDHLDGVNILAAAGREIGEEIEYEGEITGARFIGGINEDDNEVGSVHFGLFFLVDISSNIVRPKDKEIAWGEAMPVNEIVQLFNQDGVNVEGWSKIVLPHVR